MVNDIIHSNQGLKQAFKVLLKRILAGELNVKVDVE